MTAPVFDPRLFEVDPTEASVTVLLTMQKIWTAALTAGHKQGYAEGMKELTRARIEARDEATGLGIDAAIEALERLRK